MTTKKQLTEAENERAARKDEKKTAKTIVFLILGVLASGIIRAVGIYCFIVPNEFAPGGVTGAASMLEYVTGWSSGWFLAMFNVPLVILAFIFMNKRFAIMSGAAILISSGLMVLFKYIGFPTFAAANPTDADRILYAIAGGIVGGAGGAIILKLGGSSGGTDIIASIIQKKYSATNVSWFIFALDSTVVLASAAVYDNPIVPILLSFVEMFASAKVTETILQGFKSALKFEIITSNPEGLSQDIMSKLHRGVTMIQAKGMYTGEDKAMLVCVLRKRQLSQFRAILKQYPDAFAYISGTSEVMGKGFTKS